MSLRVWRFVCIYLVAITLSLTFSHLLEMPRKLAYGQALYMSVQHTMYLYFAVVGAPAEIGAVLCLSVLCFLVRRRGAIFSLTLGATICVAAGLLVWFVVVAPANAEMAQWTTVPLPDNWESTRRHWEFGHSVSAILDLIGFGALIASVLLETDHIPPKLSPSTTNEGTEKRFEPAHFCVGAARFSGRYEEFAAKYKKQKSGRVQVGISVTFVGTRYAGSAWNQTSGWRAIYARKPHG